MRLVLAFILFLLQPWPIEPPRLEWALDNQRLVLTWTQEVSGERCFALEEPYTPYGCVWAFQGAERITLPRRTAAASPRPPLPGDTILMDDTRLTVPPRPVRLFFPVASTPPQPQP